MKYTCPCYGYKTLPEEPPDTYYICGICYWEDDRVQFYKPDSEGGANEVSLKQAQKISFNLEHLPPDLCGFSSLSIWIYYIKMYDSNAEVY